MKVGDLPAAALYRPAPDRARIAARSWVTNRVPEPPPETATGAPADPERVERGKRAWRTRRANMG